MKNKKGLLLDALAGFVLTAVTAITLVCLVCREFILLVSFFRVLAAHVS